MARDPGPAIRIDPRTGVREEVAFFGPDGMKMLGFLHIPAGEPRGGLVICSPLLAEFRKNYRREILLSRLLAENGFAVQRFHYRGAGHSDGDSRDMTFDSLRTDALAAAQQLIRMTGSARIAFLGTRLGGLVATSAAKKHEGAPMILWEPTSDSSRYVGEAFRSRLITGVGEASRADTPHATSVSRELQHRGFIDILGYPIHDPLYESLKGHTLVGEIDHAAPILLIQLSRSPGLRREYAQVIAEWESLGFAVTSHVVPEGEAWWFTGDDAHEDEHRENVKRPIQITEGWLSTQFPRGEVT